MLLGLLSRCELSSKNVLVLENVLVIFLYFVFPQRCVLERDGYYNLKVLKGVPPEIREKLETGEASSIIPEVLFPKLEHKYRLGSDILIRSFNTYYMQMKHPLKAEIDKSLLMIIEGGIPEHIRLK